MDLPIQQSPEEAKVSYFQLFHVLKQKFPHLRDNDVADSIQKFGLNFQRCVEDLARRVHLPHGGYYGPWRGVGSNQSSPLNISNASSRLTSPQRGDTPVSPTTYVGAATCTTSVLTTTTPESLPSTTALHYSMANHFIESHGSTTSPVVIHVPGLSPTDGMVYTSAGSSSLIMSSAFVQASKVSPPIGWNVPISSELRTAPMHQSRHRHNQAIGEEFPFQWPNDLTHSSATNLKVLPNSAPVMPATYQPFEGFPDTKEEPSRRRSAETPCDSGRGVFYDVKNLEHQMETCYLNPRECSASPNYVYPRIGECNPGVAATNEADPSPTSHGTALHKTASSRPSSQEASAELLENQRIRKERLEQEILQSTEDKRKLQSDVERMECELQEREQRRKLRTVETLQRIEELQMENQSLQSEFDQLEGELLLRGESLDGWDGNTDTESKYVPHPQTGPSHQLSPSFVSVPRSSPQMHRGSSGSVQGSGRLTPQTPHSSGGFIPTRPAPPPPPAASSIYQQHSSQGYQGVAPVNPPASDEGGPRWSCERCTFSNHPEIDICEMCNSPRFTLVGELP